MKLQASLLTLVPAALLACDEPAAGDEPVRCGWSEPHRLFAHDFSADNGLSFGPTTDLRPHYYDLTGDLFFATHEGTFTAGPCGEDLAPARPGDGLMHPHADLALDCAAGVALRRDASGELAPARVGVSCDWLLTPEGVLARTVSDDGEDQYPLRLLDFRDPALPIVALSDEPIDGWADHVGPRDLTSFTYSSDRLRTGYFGSPYILRTLSGKVLHVDRDTWATRTVLTDVAELWPAPDGRAFAYHPRRADGSSGDLRVRVVASGNDSPVVAADELATWPFPWWSADSTHFAGPTATQGDRVLALASGELLAAPVAAYVQREVGDGALWLTASYPASAVDREIYWEPATGLRRDLYSHRPLASNARRASADGLEIRHVPALGEDSLSASTLIFVPFDGSPRSDFIQPIYPWYWRLADRSIVTVGAETRPFNAGGPDDLLLLPPTDVQVVDGGALLDRSVVPLGPLLTSDGGHDGGYFRVVGDLLIYAVRDDEHGRSGVWAISLSELPGRLVPLPTSP